VSGDHFAEFLPQMVASDQPALVPPALEVLAHASGLSADMCEIVVDVLAPEERPAVLLRLAALLGRFRSVFQPACGPRIFALLLGKVAPAIYNVQVALVRAAVLYFDPAFAADLRVFAVFLRFAACEEVAPGACEVLLAMVRAAAGHARAEMEAMLADSGGAFEDLCGSDNDEVAAAAQQIALLLEPGQR
jgi:hypothetical protein